MLLNADPQNRKFQSITGQKVKYVKLSYTPDINYILR